MHIQSLFQCDLFLQVRGITSGRLESILAAAIGLISVIIGARAMRPVGATGSRRPRAIVAILMGMIGTILSGLHLTRSYGANFGTGSGKAGAILGLAFGLIGMVLGRLALARFRRIAMRNSNTDNQS